MIHLHCIVVAWRAVYSKFHSGLNQVTGGTLAFET